MAAKRRSKALVSILCSVFALFAFCSTGYSMVEGNEWKIFNESSFHQWSYDARKVEYSKNRVARVWAKSSAKSQASINEKIRLLKKFGGSTWGYENYLYTLNLFEIDCPKKKHRLVMVKDYDRSENILESAVSQDRSWDSIPPGSIIESLYGIVCSEARKR